MIRDDKLRYLALAMAAVLAAGCDSGTDPGPLSDFDASAITAAVEAAFAPIDASSSANFALSSFVGSTLTAGSAFRNEGAVRIRDTRIQAVVRQVGFDTEVDIPAEMHGQTFVYDPTDGVWEPDENRTGAPANGVRVIWYSTDDIGIIQPLEEQGYIDLTEDDTPALDRLGVVIVRNAGTIILADFIHGHDATETETSWTEVLEFAGTFSDGTATSAVDMSLEASGVFDGAEAYVWDIFLTGAETSYRWVLDGGYDEAGAYDEDLIVTIDHAALRTILDLRLTGDDGEASGSGTGTLSHAGATIANVTSGDQAFVFSKPGGGSFSAQEENQLSLLTTTMVLYGPLTLISMPLVFGTL